MTDLQSPYPPEPPVPPWRRWLTLLGGRRGVLLVAAVVLGILVAAHRVAIGDAVLVVAVTGAAALLIPRRAGLRAEARPAAERNALRRATTEAFADALADPCVILDARTLVLHANPAARLEFPTTRVGDPVGLSLRYPVLLTAIETARRTGAPQSAELHRTAPAESWHMLVAAPLRGAGGEDTGMLVVTLRNRTEEKRVDAMRADFIANASHELRTPLTSLVGFIDTLLGPAARDAEARTRFLNIMRAQAARMSKLIDDLLSLSRIEMRQHMRPTGTLDLVALLHEVREGLQTQAGEAGVVVALETAEPEAMVTGDHDELYEVFENLLDNAVKYGSDGGHVEITLAPDQRAGPGYLVAVIDHGAGVPPEHVPRLTERFYRVDEESSRRKKGTGLGLAIVKHIVSRHRGSLAIRSRPGEGTRVEVVLPR